MRSSFAVNVLVAAVVALGAGAFSSCGSVTPASDGGAAGTMAGTSGGGTTGAAGTGGTTGVAGTTGTAGNSGGGAGGVANTGGRGGAGGAANTGGAGGAANTGGRGGAGAGPDGGVLTCRVDANDCPQGSTCACGGAGPVGMCTCHKNCTDTNQCGTLEPMCGCPGSTTGTARYCVNACFCSCG